MKHIVGLSGGKDSTAMALWLVENEPRDYEFICTPTGEEPPEWDLHMDLLEIKLGQKIQRITETTLEALILKWKALPNFRQRWCTRVLKIEPFYNYVFNNLPAVCYVGLRADEMQCEGFTTDKVDGFEQRFIMQEIGWNIEDVYDYLNQHQIKIDFRTDCMNCFYQQLGEWEDLYRDKPEQFERYAKMERDVGHTFRSPSRDTWPASLDGLAQEFDNGRVPRRRKNRIKNCAWCAA